MNKNKYIGMAAIVLTALVSCSKEAEFKVDGPGSGEGRILSSALNLEVKGETIITKAPSVPSPEDFTVNFINIDKDDEAPVTYSYKDMPEVVILPVGTYKVLANYGGDYGEEGATAAFDSPHYSGESEIFTVENAKIVDKIKPITCTLANVKVRVNFDDSLLKVMGGDVKVAVRVGEAGGDVLEFTAATHSDGYFKYADNSTTLAATFSGTVNGDKITEIKTYSNVKPGTFYNITFKLHTITPENPGDLNPDKPDNPTPPDDPNVPDNPEDKDGNMTSHENGLVIVDAAVTVHDYTENDGDVNVNPDEEIYLEDERYPSSGNQGGNQGGTGNNGEEQDPPGGETPGPGPEEQGEKPIITSQDVDVDAVNNITNWVDDSPCVVKILTDSKISEFRCLIVSETLTKEVLEDVNITDDLDLVNGSEDSTLWINLRSLGFPVGTDVTDPQEKEGDKFVIRFDITNFVPILKIYEGEHKFIFTVTNESGTTNKTLILKAE